MKKYDHLYSYYNCLRKIGTFKFSAIYLYFDTYQNLNCYYGFGLLQDIKIDMMKIQIFIECISLLALNLDRSLSYGGVILTLSSQCDISRIFMTFLISLIHRLGSCQ